MRSDKEKTKINSAIDAALKNIGALIDVNTVIGTPISVPDGSLIIPLSKVTFGILAGGGEYGKISIFSKSDELPCSAGNGSIVSIKPCGFLIKSENADYRIISFSGNTYEGLFDKASEFITNYVKNVSYDGENT